MKQKEDSFFTSPIHNFQESGYSQTDWLVKTAEAISRLTYKSLYIFDYLEKGFHYVSPNPLFLCGHMPEEVKKMGYKFFIYHVPPEEHIILREINEAAWKFYQELTAEEKTNYTIYANFHLMKNKKKWLINYKSTPILLNEKGECWFSMCILSLSAYPTTGHIIMRKENQSNYWEYDLNIHQWIKRNGIVLNEKEKDILSLSSQGFTMEEIANKLFVAVDTVKFYKRRLFNEKLHVKNIVEAISFATCYKLL